MEEQGGETLESKYRWLRYGSITEEPPEGFSFMYHKIQTETGEKLLPITMDGIPILQVKPGYRNNNKPQPSEIPLDLMKYLFPDYDPSDPYRHISSGCPGYTPIPCVFLNEAHKKRVLDAQAAAIQRRADLKRRQEEALEAFNRNYAANSSAPTASSSGTQS